MNVLGISCFYHDAAAALYRDGALVAAAEEERFTRRKHDSEFPAHAARYCLESAGLTIDQIDRVVFYEKPLRKFGRILVSAANAFPDSFGMFRYAMRVWWSQKLWTTRIIREELGYTGKIVFGDHHLSHAASAFFVSPFERAAILTADGVGEWTTCALWLGEGRTIRPIEEIRFPHSIGLLYSALTGYLGFEVNEGEYKVMGMAAYGRPTQVDGLRRLIDVRADGSFRLDMRYFAFEGQRRALSRRFYDEFGPPRERDAPLDQRYADLAASLQRLTEDTLVAIAHHLWERTRVDDLCMAGGVALNCLANARIARETPFQRVFIQPAAGDAGGALGAAAHVSHSLLDEPRATTMDHAYWGPSWSTTEVRAFLDRNAVPYTVLDDAALARAVATRLAANEVVGWFHGRMEFGPRALGARSILASPIDPQMKDILNERIKHREAFRPFAPAVLTEDAAQYFDLDAPSPFMLLTAQVRPEMRDKIPAVTHEDGTARVQMVDRAVNPLYYDVIAEFKRQTGVAVLVNTSFNVRGEPIVCTPEDAYRCFAATDIDALAIENCIVTHKKALAGPPRTAAAGAGEVIL